MKNDILKRLHEFNDCTVGGLTSYYVWEGFSRDTFIDVFFEMLEERSVWVDSGGYVNPLKRPVPEMKTVGEKVLYEDGFAVRPLTIKLYETEDWNTLFVGDSMVYDGHIMDGTDILSALGIKHEYLYVDDPDDFEELVRP